MEIGYQLRDRQLLVSYAVTNHDTQIMFFSIGAHPAFNTPGNFEDWFIEFDQAETVDRHYLAGGVFSGETAPVLNDQTVLHLNDGLFERDAIVLKTLRSKTVRLRSTASTRQITLDFGGFPYLGIWTKTAAPFVCLEPWYGLADSANSDGQLAHKEGIQNLAPGQTFNSLYTLAFE